MLDRPFSLSPLVSLFSHPKQFQLPIIVLVYQSAPSTVTRESLQVALIFFFFPRSTKGSDGSSSSSSRQKW